jgi:deoxyadenosine/deoxycytidine kinase
MHAAILRAHVDFRYLAIEGPVGVGKSALAERLAGRLEARAVLDETDNPFLADCHAGRTGAAFQAQLFFTLARHRQLSLLRQRELFSQTTVCDYLFERDRIYAFITLDDNELFIYQRLFELLVRDVPVPDVVVYLQAPAEAIRRRLHERERRSPDPVPVPDDVDVSELNEAYNHFFFHYTATPLLVVETSHVDLTWGDEAVDELLRQVRSMARGTQYYVPR